MLVAGGAIGAGMFALPLVSSGAWFAYAVIGLIITVGFTYLSVSLLVDVNAAYAEGSSFNTIVSDTLGARWALLNNLSVAFILFILMYAYITAGAGILERSLIKPIIEGYFDSNIALPRALLSGFFALLIAAFIALGTSSVSRLSSVLMLAMCVSFLTANSGLLVSLDFAVLGQENGGELRYLWSALPVFVTAFACAGLVPSLKAIKLSIFIGLFLTFIVYLMWLASTLASVSRVGFVGVAQDGGGLNALIIALQGRTDSALIQFSLNWFSNFAVITSFLSVGLGLVHFLIDRFDFKGKPFANIKAVLLAFIPTIFASAYAPYGFVSAIAYAGVFVALSFFILPALMYREVHNCPPVLSSKGLAWSSVAVFGLMIVVLKLATVFGALPNYP